MAPLDDISAIDATGIAELIREGEVSSREAVEAHLRRFESVNPRLNAIVVPRFEQALREADGADAATKGERGPLHGVPITIKECFDLAGMPSTVGLTERVGRPAAADAPLVARLRRAGAIVLGKTNLSQLMLWAESENPVYGRTNNPWDRSRSPGGSSGGEGAAIASGCSPLGMGSDFGGSVRIPAHFCGVCALKPTSGRLTMVGSGDALDRQEALSDQAGPMARSVRDLELAFSVLAAPEPEARDPLVPPVAVRGSSDISIAGLRIGFYEYDGFFEASPALRRAVREAAGALSDLGAEVSELRPPDVEDAYRIYLGLFSADGGANMWRQLGDGERDPRIKPLERTAKLPRPIQRALPPLLGVARQRRLAFMAGSTGPRSVDAYWGLLAERKRYRAHFMAALDRSRLDAVVCPPFPTPAMTHGASSKLGPVGAYTTLYNFVGMPAGVVPATRVRAGEESDRRGKADVTDREARAIESGSAGLPVGVQVAARHWREDVALAVMAALERHFRARSDHPSGPPV